MKSTFVDELKTELRNDPSRLSWYVEFVSLDRQAQNRILSKEAPNAVVVALLAAVLEALQPLNHPMFSTLDVILDPETALHSKAICIGEDRAAYVPSLVCVAALRNLTTCQPLCCTVQRARPEARPAERGIVGPSLL